MRNVPNSFYTIRQAVISWKGKKSTCFHEFGPKDAAKIEVLHDTAHANSKIGLYFQYALPYGFVLPSNANMHIR